MITLTTELKSRRFKENEKRQLYRRLTEPLNNRVNELKTTFISFLEENVLEKYLDQDLLELGQKIYCSDASNSFRLSPDSFGLCSCYVGSEKFKECKTSLCFDFYSEKYHIANISGGIRTMDISDIIVKNCSEDIKEQVKYFLYELAKAKYEYLYFGLGTFIKPKNSNYHFFCSINTWGGLYKADPKIFEELYNYSFNSTKTEEHPEKKLLETLKFSLGY